jgi:hypothetical protein
MKNNEIILDESQFYIGYLLNLNKISSSKQPQLMGKKDGFRACRSTPVNGDQ